MIDCEDVLRGDLTFRYQLLGRLQSDCEYYLNYGSRDARRLWTGDECRQIELMRRLYESFADDEKPQWLTMEEINAYGEKMILSDEEAGKNEVSICPFSLQRTECIGSNLPVLIYS